MAWWIWTIGGLISTIGVGLAITKAWATHDWKKCQCVDCRQRRYHIMKGRGYHVTGVWPDGDLKWGTEPIGPPGGPPYAGKSKVHWISTAQLEPRMVVKFKGKPYLILEIRTDQKGYLVSLYAKGGPKRRVPMTATVNWANGNKKYWEPM